VGDAFPILEYGPQGDAAGPQPAGALPIAHAAVATTPLLVARGVSRTGFERFAASVAPAVPMTVAQVTSSPAPLLLHLEDHPGRLSGSHVHVSGLLAQELVPDFDRVGARRARVRSTWRFAGGAITGRSPRLDASVEYPSSLPNTRNGGSDGGHCWCDVGNP
jgi:hypothetical protein